MADSVVYIATQRIESKVKQGSSALKNVKSDAIDLLSELNSASKLLADAEGSGLSMSHEVQTKVREVIGIAYEAEDEVDTLGSGSSSFFPRNSGVHRAKLRGLTERIRVVKTWFEDHAQACPSNEELISPACGTQAPTSPKPQLPANGEPDIGIDQEITRIVDQLTRNGTSNNGQPPITRLAIVGMGGSGKTSLAKSIYNNKAVRNQFHFQAWVSVSRDSDTTVMLCDMLNQIIRRQRSFFASSDKDGLVEDGPNNLVTRLNSLLNKKSCLLVLDDVWDLHSLHKFIALIQGDDHESSTYTIIITSRRNPLNYIDWSIHQPRQLNDEDSWKLLSMVASNSSRPISTEYHDVAMELLRKCQGLPLAIVALAKHLKKKGSKREWQILSTQIEGEEGASIYGPVREILGLSYDELPSHLKPCFLYLGLFPEDFTISGGTLVRMWIAEGFIKNEHLSDDKESLEKVGRRYLQELIDHSMVQVVEKTCSGKAKFIRNHTIMRDFCLLKAKELDFLAVSSSRPETIGQTSRRAAIYPSERSSSIILPANNTHLRSITLFGRFCTSLVSENYTRTPHVKQINNLDKVLQMYKLLRVLDIVGIKSHDGTLPKEIGNLIHLTYLRIRSTNIRELPESIGQLHNLLTLDYWDVSAETEVKVPDVLWKLKRLRHLYLPDEMCGSIKALRLDTLKDLVILWGVGGGNWMLKEISKLRSTLSKLHIHCISTKDQLTAVFDCPAMRQNGSLYALALHWCDFEFNVFNKLSANTGLLRLKLMGNAPVDIQGCEFPSNLTKLELHYTHLERPGTMALLGTLISLKVLNLAKDSYIGDKWSCGEEAFPILEELKLAKLPKLETWEIEKGAFRCLKKLSIVSCIKLKGMPEGLKHVSTLEKLDIKHMPSNFSSRLLKVKERKEQGEDFHIIKHIPQFTCNP